MSKKILALFLVLTLTLSVSGAAFAAADGSGAPAAPEIPYTEMHVECKSGDLTLRGVLTLPLGYTEGDKVPIVILSHGFMSDIFEFAFAPFSLAYALADAGYASVRFSFGGTGESDGEFKDMTIASEVADLNAIIDYVKALDCVDTDNIFLQGNSFGGVVTALTAPGRADDINAVCLWFPAMSMCDDARGGHVQDVEFDVDNVPETLDVRGWTVGKGLIEEELALDPYAPAAEYTGDVLILHGAADDLVPIASSEKLADMYENAVLIPIEGGGHGFYDPDTNAAASGAMIEFLDAHLKGEAAEPSETPTAAPTADPTEVPTADPTTAPTDTVTEPAGTTEEVPKTGGPSNAGLLAAILVVSLCGAAATAVSFRRSRNEH